MTRKPTIAILGAGRVGQSLGRALRERGYRISAVIARGRAHALRARRFVGAGKATSDFSATGDAHVLLIATPDRAIAEVSRKLARVLGQRLRGRVALHTSGALTSAALRPFSLVGAKVGSLHPLQTFDRPAAPRTLRGVVFAIEGERAACARAARLARELGGVPVRVSSRAKALYHAAATLACGRLLALADGAARLLVGAGLSPAQARKSVARLAGQTLMNLERGAGRAAWTGPLERGDRSTLRLHAQALRHVEPEFRDVYRTLGELALRLYRPRDRKLKRAFERLFTR